MCILLLTTSHPTYPTILLSNRDEFLSRPTARATWWPSPSTHILGGRDLQRPERGTWLGIATDGRVAALTNFREEGDQFAPTGRSRGAIPTAWLGGEAKGRKEFAGGLVEGEGKGMGGFSLVFGYLQDVGRGNGLGVLSNRSTSGEDVTTLVKGVGETRGLSNSFFGDRTWPKVVRGERLLEEAVEADVREPSDRDGFVEALFGILSTDHMPVRGKDESWDEYVRHMRTSILIPPTGVDAVTAGKVAAAQSKEGSGYDTPDHNGPRMETGMGGYGTQKQTVVLVDQKGKVRFVERTLYDENGRPMPHESKDTSFEFQIEGWDR